MDHDELLRIMARGDAHGDLHWGVNDDGSLRFFVDCSDTFGWACADAEPVESDADVAAVEQARADCAGLKGDYHWPTLYCARRRKERPMPAWFKQTFVKYENAPELRELFEAVGPARESTSFAP